MKNLKIRLRSSHSKRNDLLATPHPQLEKSCSDYFDKIYERLTGEDGYFDKEELLMAESGQRLES